MDATTTIPLGLVPPVQFRDGFIRSSITRDSSHDCQIVLFDDLLHHLDGAEIPEHVTSPGKP